MFRKSETEKQLNLFSSSGELIQSTANYYQEGREWQISLL